MSPFHKRGGPDAPLRPHPRPARLTQSAGGCGEGGYIISLSAFQCVEDLEKKAGKKNLPPTYALQGHGLGRPRPQPVPVPRDPVAARAPNTGPRDRGWPSLDGRTGGRKNEEKERLGGWVCWVVWVWEGAS